jgi:hypothetical protein
MSRLLTSDTAKRLTAAEALEHPWMTGGASKTPFVKTVMNNLKDFTATSKFKTGTHRAAQPPPPPPPPSATHATHSLCTSTALLRATGWGASQRRRCVAVHVLTVFPLVCPVLLVSSLCFLLAFPAGILKIMTDTMSEKELSELKTVFKELDANGDGSVTVTELSQALEKAGTSARKEEILQLLASADIDGDGSLSFEVRARNQRTMIVCDVLALIVGGVPGTLVRHVGRPLSHAPRCLLFGTERVVRFSVFSVPVCVCAGVDHDGRGSQDFRQGGATVGGVLESRSQQGWKGKCRTQRTKQRAHSPS